MSNKNPGPTPLGANPEVPLDLPLPEVMESLPGDILKETSPYSAPKPIKTVDAIAEISNRLTSALTSEDYRNDYLLSVRLSNQLLLYRVGAQPLLPLLRQPDNAKTTLVPALDAILESAPTLFIESRSVLEGIDLDKLTVYQSRLLFLRQVIEQAVNQVEALQALESHLEVELDSVAETVYRRSESIALTNPTLGKMLRPLTIHYTQSAQQAAETKKKFAKLREESKNQAEPKPSDKPQSEPKAPTVPPPNFPPKR